MELRTAPGRVEAGSPIIMFGTLSLRDTRSMFSVLCVFTSLFGCVSYFLGNDVCLCGRSAQRTRVGTPEDLLKILPPLRN